MSEATLTATEQVIDANAEAAKAAARAEEVSREEFGTVAVQVEEAIVAAVEKEEVKEEEEWQRVQTELTALRVELTQLREVVTEQNKSLSSQLLSSMTEVYQTALENLKALLTPPVQNPPVNPSAEESAVVIRAPAEVPEAAISEQQPKKRTRKI